MNYTGAALRIVMITLTAGLVSLLAVAVLAVVTQRRVRIGLLMISAAGILIMTLLRRTPSVRRLVLTPLWSYANLGRIECRHEILQNIILFIPYGAALAAVRLKRPVLIALFTSAAVEGLQYAFALGTCETDDLIHNTFGAAAGVLLFALFCRLRQAADAKRHPSEKV